MPRDISLSTTRDNLNNYETRYGSGGFEYHVLFHERGYTPHQVNHQKAMADWTDTTEVGESTQEGDEILFMCDPHTAISAFIYNLRTKQIEWEYDVSGSGTASPNPHQGFIADFDNADQNIEKGDIVITNQDNKIVVVDRETKNKKTEKDPIGMTTDVLHCVHPSKDRNHLLLTDYQSHEVAKLQLSDLNAVQNNTFFDRPSKITTIPDNQRHFSDYGGDYLVCFNTRGGVVMEVNEDLMNIWDTSQNSDSRTASRGNFNNSPIPKPHRAYRSGRVEQGGGVTITHSEATGTIMGIDRYARPVWAVGVPTWEDLSNADTDPHYHTDENTLGEVTEVFESLQGRVGFSNWFTENSALVGEITKLPEKQSLHYARPTDYSTGDSFEWMDPIRAQNADEIGIVINNRGTNSLDYEVYRVQGLDFSIGQIGDAGTQAESSRIEEASGSVASGGKTEVNVTNAATYVIYQFKSTSAGSSTTLDCHVTVRR